MLYFLNIYTLDSWETRGHTSKTWQILTGCFVFFLLNQLVVYLIQSFPLICSVLDKKWQECCGRPISQHKPTSFRTLWSCRDISRHVISRVNAKPKLPFWTCSFSIQAFNERIKIPTKTGRCRKHLLCCRGSESDSIQTLRAGVSWTISDTNVAVKTSNKVRNDTRL